MSRRNDISLLWGTVALALVATPASAEPKPVDSWGRAGIDYDTYRNDSLECGLVGYYADVSNTEQAQLFVGATRQLESVDNPNYAPPSASVEDAAAMGAEQARRYEQIRRSIRPEQRMKELKEGMVAVVEDCLAERGYIKFRLTEDQSAALADLDRGSDERRAFLYGLASNPDVLDAQALELGSP
jgi:hypothetical protein